MSEEQKQMQSKFVAKYSVPAMVADKVMDALASAAATVDSVALSRIMSAYLLCQQGEGAINAFEAVTRINANGLSLLVSIGLYGKHGGQIAVNCGDVESFY